ncbi:MAG: GldG family protein [Opitutaceae bacterium]|jgi:ABC-type uncharacterized transport system involved in gliding motility auxiliary subunit|nr:GldG family protein [Opitutaceae bacterium]
MSLFHSFRAARWLRTTNLLLQAVLFVTFFVGLNHLASRYAWRFDLTQLRRHSLSAETKSYLAQLGEPVRIIVTLPREDEGDPDQAAIYRDVRGLLREYTYAADSTAAAGRIRVDYIDVYQRPREAGQLNLTANTVLFLSGEHDARRREVPLADLYRRRDGRRVAFLGEQAFTAAILDVSGPGRKKIYFLAGHGEMDPNAVDPVRGLSELRDALRQRNYALDMLDLARARVIPEDAAVVLSAGAQTRYESYEQETLRDYMTARAGRMALFLQPALNPTGLEELLNDWGILADDVLVRDRGAGGRADNGDLILSALAPPPPLAPHPATQLLIENQLVLRFGATRAARPAPARATDPGLAVTPLVATAPTAWGERDHRRRPHQFNPAADLAGPLAVVTAAERVKASDLRFSVPVGRIVVFGSADFLANGRLRAGANAPILFSTLNWLVDRDTLLNIPARPVERFQLALSRDRLRHLRYMLLFAVPGAAALLGLLVYWTRRK